MTTSERTRAAAQQKDTDTVLELMQGRCLPSSENELSMDHEEFQEQVENQHGKLRREQQPNDQKEFLRQLDLEE